MKFGYKVGENFNVQFQKISTKGRVGFSNWNFQRVGVGGFLEKIPSVGGGMHIFWEMQSIFVLPIF